MTAPVQRRQGEPLQKEKLKGYSSEMLDAQCLSIMKRTAVQLTHSDGEMVTVHPDVSVVSLRDCP
jgi:hypothetical protein